MQVGLAAKSGLTSTEFLRIVDRIMEESCTVKFFDECFEAFDRDGDGFVSAGDLRGFLSEYGDGPVTDETLAAMLHEADKDKDGKVNPGQSDLCSQCQIESLPLSD